MIEIIKPLKLLTINYWNVAQVLQTMIKLFHTYIYSIWIIIKRVRY